MKDFNGLAKSTYYYRKKHPQNTSYANIARKFGVSRQCLCAYARKHGITDCNELEAAYATHRQKKAARKKNPFNLLYAEFEILSTTAKPPG